MSASQNAPRKRLPVNPSLENLKKQAKHLAKSRPALSLQQAQHQLAVEYGCANWVQLSHMVQTMSRGATQTIGANPEREPLPEAANRNDLDAVQKILAAGPFTQHDLDLALARAVLRYSERRAIAELLIDHGADPNGQYGSAYGPVVFVTGECLDPDGLQFLIDRGADVAFPPITTKYNAATPMSHALGTYARGQNRRKHRCIEILLKHGAVIPPEITPPMLAIHQGNAQLLADFIQADPSLLSQRFPTMPYGNIALQGATLTHLATEFGELECLDVLLNHNADINSRADTIDEIGGQTPIFHAIATIHHAGIPVLEHLIRRAPQSLDVSIRATFRLYGQPQATPMTPLEYAQHASTPETPDWRRSTEQEITLLKTLSP